MDSSSNKTGRWHFAMSWTWLRNRNLERETESIFIVAQNNVIRNNYIKAMIDNSH